MVRRDYDLNKETEVKIGKKVGVTGVPTRKNEDDNINRRRNVVVVNPLYPKESDFIFEELPTSHYIITQDLMSLGVI